MFGIRSEQGAVCPVYVRTLDTAAICQACEEQWPLLPSPLALESGSSLMGLNCPNRLQAPLALSLSTHTKWQSDFR